VLPNGLFHMPPSTQTFCESHRTPPTTTPQPAYEAGMYVPALYR